MGAQADRDPLDPIGAPALPAVEVEHRVSVPSYTDAADIVMRLVEACDGVDLVWIRRRRTWLGLRHEVRFALRGRAWDVEQLWQEVRGALPRGGAFTAESAVPFDPLP